MPVKVLFRDQELIPDDVIAFVDEFQCEAAKTLKYERVIHPDFFDRLMRMSATSSTAFIVGAYCFAFMHNRERLLDLVKKSPQVQIVQRNGKIFFVPVNKESQP